MKSHLSEGQFADKLETTKVTKERAFGVKSMKISYLSFYPNLYFNYKRSNTMITPEER